MTSHLWMFLLFLLMGFFLFILPFFIIISEQKEIYLSVSQIGVFICTYLSGLSAFDDVKKLAYITA